MAERWGDLSCSRGVPMLEYEDISTMRAMVICPYQGLDGLT